MAMKSFLKYIIIFLWFCLWNVQADAESSVIRNLSVSFVICLFQMDFRIWWLM